jgi:hypothetical protein
MAWTNILQIFFPVGSVYFSTVNSSPASTIGGTWTQITNRFIRTGTSPTTTGGSDTHSHQLSDKGGALIDAMPGTNNEWLNLATSATARSFTPTNKHAFWTKEYNPSAETAWHAVALIGSTDSEGSLPSYYTVCMWVRIA